MKPPLFLMLLLEPLVAALATAPPSCSCDHMANLETRVAGVEKELAGWRTEAQGWRAEAQQLKALLAQHAPAMAPAAAGAAAQAEQANGAYSTTPQRRSLQTSAKKVWQQGLVHSFSDADSCFGTNNHELIKLTRLGSGEVSISGMSSTEVARVAAPFTVDHGASCSSTNPTLTIALNAVFNSYTHFEGGLSVTSSGTQRYALHHSHIWNLKCKAPSSSQASGKCAGMSGANFLMRDCNLDHDEVRLSWYGEMITTQRGGSIEPRCMQAQRDGNVVSSACNNVDGFGSTQTASEMYFYFDGEAIKNRFDGGGSCMQCGVPSNSLRLDDLVMAPCDGSDSQKWVKWWPGMAAV